MLHEGGVDLLVCLALGFELRRRRGGRPNQQAQSGRGTSAAADMCAVQAVRRV